MGFIHQSQPDQFVEQLKTLPEAEFSRRIRLMGHWRIWIRPTVFERARFQNLRSCRMFALSNAVNGGGWQYPLAHDERIVDGDEWVGSEVELPPHLETWKLFRSAQFTYRIAFAEEYIGTDAWPVRPLVFIPGEAKRYLNIFRTLRVVTCVCEFAARMAGRGFLEPSASISISLHGVDGRELSYMTPKHELDGKYWGRNESIEIERTVSAESFRTTSRELAIDITTEIFRGFGWPNSPRALFAEEQTRILNS
jgi:hypothetical protein